MFMTMPRRFVGSVVLDFVVFTSISCAARRISRSSADSSNPLIVSTGATHEEATATTPLALSDRCSVTADDTYGRTVKNPIKVGGGVIAGPAREIVYMRVLRGPTGQGINFKRIGSTMTPDLKSIDIYQVTYLGQDKPVMLYVDEYDWSAPLIPVGFVCSEAIPLKAP